MCGSNTQCEISYKLIQVYSASHQQLEAVALVTFSKIGWAEWTYEAEMGVADLYGAIFDKRGISVMAATLSFQPWDAP